MSATHPTRLKTRTKESNTCASQRLYESRCGAMKVKAALAGGRAGNFKCQIKTPQRMKTACEKISKKKYKVSQL
ncbi:hypothetical protein AB1E18_018407 [Capra hircus]